MTRKRFIKKMMALGQPRNIARQQTNIVKLTGNYDNAYTLCLKILLSAVENIEKV